MYLHFFLIMLRAILKFNGLNKNYQYYCAFTSVVWLDII